MNVERPFLLSASQLGTPKIRRDNIFHVIILKCMCIELKEAIDAQVFLASKKWNVEQYSLDSNNLLCKTYQSN